MGILSLLHAYLLCFEYLVMWSFVEPILNLLFINAAAPTSQCWRPGSCINRSRIRAINWQSDEITFTRSTFSAFASLWKAFFIIYQYNLDTIYDASNMYTREHINRDISYISKSSLRFCKIVHSLMYSRRFIPIYVDWLMTVLTSMSFITCWNLK